MSLEMCLKGLDELKNERARRDDPTWIPDDLVDILLLLPHEAQEQDFRDIVYVLSCMRVSTTLFQPSNWIPSSVDVKEMLHVGQTYGATLHSSTN